MRILLIEDNPGDVRLLQEYLLKDGTGREQFQLVHAERLARGLELLKAAAFDAVLLDLSLPDSQGTDTLVRARAAAQGVPIVVMTSLDDDAVGLQLLHAGAQDYLVKGDVTGSLLRRSLRYAVERKRAEKELLESESRLRAILDHSPGLVFLKDLDGRYLHVNRQFERTFHMTSRDVAGKRDEDIFPAEQAAQFHANDRKVLEAGVPLEFEEVALHDDGLHTSIVSKFPLYNGDGEVYALCGITTDITERKRAEEAIRNSEARLAGILGLADDAIITIDDSQRVVMFNQGAERIFGYPAGEMIGQPLIRLMPSRYHEIHPRYIAAFDKEQKVAEGTRQRMEIVGLRKDGTEFPAEASMTRLEQHGCVTFTVILRDIAQRKRAERELRRSEVFLQSIVENIPHMIFVKDAQHLRFLRFNRAGEQLLGILRHELIGKSDHDLFPKDEADFFTAKDREVLRDGKSLDIPEEPILTRSKGLRFLHTKKIPILDEKDRPLYLLGISEDITERKQAEEQLQRSLEQLRTLAQRLDVVREEERTRIARELHDEFGVRMTCLKLDLARLQAFMRESLFPREKMEDKIRSMSADADATIAEVQRLAAELRPGVLDDLGLVAAIEWQCQDFERRSGIRCLCEASQEQIQLDPARATAAFRICQEALTNVARHAGATFVRILVSQIENDVLIEIQDNGRGVPGEKLNDSDSLGLLGMRERSMGLGGRLEIAGWHGKGTTVTLRLPRQGSEGP